MVFLANVKHAISPQITMFYLQCDKKYENIVSWNDQKAHQSMVQALQSG